MAHLNPEPIMIATASHPTPRRGSHGTAATSRLRAHASALVARWYAAHFTPPFYHRLGAFDLARSGLARELLQAGRR
jgi:hypothetical protein